MVLRFTAKVKKREVVVRDVDLPEGSTVDVTITPQQDEVDFELTPDQWATVRAGERAADRGEYCTSEEIFARLRRSSIYGHEYLSGPTNRGTRDPGVGALARRRKKSAAGRVRSRR